MKNSRKSEKKSFTLIELLVKRSHLCCDRVYGKEGSFSPAHGQVKLYSFTLIELLVVTSQHCRHFIHNAVFASAKTYSLFLTLRRPAGYGGQEDKTSSYNTCEANASCTAHNAVFASAKTLPLFLKRREGCGERGIIEADGRPFPRKRSFPLSPRTPLP